MMCLRSLKPSMISWSLTSKQSIQVKHLDGMTECRTRNLNKKVTNLRTHAHFRQIIRKKTSPFNIVWFLALEKNIHNLGTEFRAKQEVNTIQINSNFSVVNDVFYIRKFKAWFFEFSPHTFSVRTNKCFQLSSWFVNVAYIPRFLRYFFHGNYFVA